MRSVWSCSEWGLACCALLPGARCALTAPFHPYLCRLFRRPSAVLLSVPLSVALPRPAVSRHSALRSPDFPPRTPCGGTRRLSVRPVCGADYSRNGQGRLKVCFLCGKHLLSDGLTGRMPAVRQIRRLPSCRWNAVFRRPSNEGLTVAVHGLPGGVQPFARLFQGGVVGGFLLLRFGQFLRVGLNVGFG